MNPETPPTIAFDAYECSIEAPANQVITTLRADLDTEYEHLGSASRWSSMWAITLNRQPFCTIKDSTQRRGECHLDCKSTAHRVVPWLRERFPQHRVSRVDVCLDFYSDDYWQPLEYMLLKWATDRGEYVEPAGPHLHPHLGGRTWYKGNRHKKPQRLIRLYEKGCERQLKTRWPIRLEHQIRPKSREKSRYATMTEAEILLENPFIRHALETLQISLGDAPSPIPHPPRNDLDRVLDVLARQYLNTIKLSRERFATLDEFVLDLEQRLERDAAVTAALRNAEPTMMMQPTYQDACRQANNSGRDRQFVAMPDSE